jgi:FkbM family methyltransferase
MLGIITRPVRSLLNTFGYEVMKIQTPLTHTTTGNWISKLNIGTIIDIGSNEGQFIGQINQVIPGKKIIAFEPIKQCFEKLVVNTKNLNVLAFNCGLSDLNGTTEINISQNFVSSSILPMAKLHKNLYPESNYVNTQIIELKRLDDAIKDVTLRDNILIKMDVQGYENKVIAGGEETIKKAAILIVESSFQPIYEGQWLFEDLFQYFISKGFKFVGFTEQINSKQTGIPVYADSIFIKADLVKAAF